MMTPKRRPAAARDLSAPPAGGWWREAIALPPRKAYVYERLDKQATLYVEQYAPEIGNWQRASLRLSLFDERGRRLKGAELTARKAEAKLAAADAIARWEAERKGVRPAPAEPTRPLTLGETPAVLTDPNTGKFPAANGKPSESHAKEVLRSIAFAARTLGPETPWTAIDLDQLTTLWRARIREVAGRTRASATAKGRGKRTVRPGIGLRPAEIVIRDVLATANWLRERKRIPSTAAVAPRTWKKLLREDWVKLRGKELRTAAVPEPRRPRHTEDAFRRVLVAAWKVDPRLGLLLALGAELRAGQVKRAMRRHLALDAGAHGQLTIIGGGEKKPSTVVKLTGGQRADADRCLTTGYLHELEAAYQRGEITDYPLFPAGQMPGGRKGEPVATVARHATAGFLSGRTLLKWFHEAEDLAEVPRLPDGAFYTLRRAGVDAFKKRKGSREGLQAHGGWTSTQIPDEVYAEQEAEYAREEAAEIRAQIRGEATP